MPQWEKQGLITRNLLTGPEISELKQLAAICDRYEGLRTRLNWEIRPMVPVEDFLYYRDNMLVGYLSLDLYGVETKELLGLVHPYYRRQGIFHELLAAAKAECASRGVKQFMLICERASRSGKAFIEAIGASYALSEHEMVLAQFHDRFTFDQALVVRPAYDRDLERLIAIQMRGYGASEALARNRVERELSEPGCQTWIATFGLEGVNCAEPVGALRVYDWPGCAGIYGFIVLPEYRGRGYGRQMLEEVIRSLLTQGKKQIMLEVEVDNTIALQLYLSCGFAITTTYDYYILKI
jgi:ribosomal protein S18 acetylase RimI-like enzyme